MGKKDIRIDAYIAKSGDFAKPILGHLRELVHTASNDIEETIKWGFPHFDYKGVVCSMAAFKEHCAFSFWKSSLMKDSKKLTHKKGEDAMGNFGKITSLKDLPSDKVLITYLKEAIKLNDAGIKRVLKPISKEKKELIIPDYFLKAVKKDIKAFETFNNFNYSNKKEYVIWVTEAKTDVTLRQRLETAIEWMSEGKIRNWKYIKK